LNRGRARRVFGGERLIDEAVTVIIEVIAELSGWRATSTTCIEGALVYLTIEVIVLIVACLISNRAADSFKATLSCATLIGRDALSGRSDAEF
jgi:hypothetical protein